MDMITQIFADRKQYVMEAILAHDDGDLDMGILQGFFDMADSQVAQNMPKLGKGKGKGKAKKGKKGKRPPTGWDLWCSLTRPLFTDEVTKAKKESETHTFNEGVTVFTLVSKMLGATWGNDEIKEVVNGWAAALNTENYVFDYDSAALTTWDIIKINEKIMGEKINNFLNDDDVTTALENVWNANVSGETFSQVDVGGKQTDWGQAFLTALKTRWGEKVEVVKKVKKGKKNSDGKKTKRPPNAYQLFGTAYRERMKKDHADDDEKYKEAIKFTNIGKAWKDLQETDAPDKIEELVALKEKAERLKVAAEEEPEINESASASEESDDLGEVQTPKKKKAKKIPEAPVKKKKAKKEKVKKEKVKKEKVKKKERSRDEILDEWGDLTEYTWERYVHDNDGKAKFWELARAGKKTLSRSGSVGGNGNGRLRERDHLSEVAAKEWMTSQIKSKTKKGYKSPIEEEINLDEMLAQSSDDDSD